LQQGIATVRIFIDRGSLTSVTVKLARVQLTSEHGFLFCASWLTLLSTPKAFKVFAAGSRSAPAFPRHLSPPAHTGRGECSFQPNTNTLPVPNPPNREGPLSFGSGHPDLATP